MKCFPANFPPLELIPELSAPHFVCLRKDSHCFRHNQQHTFPPSPETLLGNNDGCLFRSKTSTVFMAARAWVLEGKCPKKPPAWYKQRSMLCSLFLLPWGHAFRFFFGSVHSRIFPTPAGFLFVRVVGEIKTFKSFSL